MRYADASASSVSRRHLLQAIGAHAALQSVSASAATVPDVIVIGAGLAGLRAALDLQELGAVVQVIEGRRRVGGRVFTLTDLPGHPEAGGNSFASGYGRCIDTAARLNVPLFNHAERLKLTPEELYLEGRHVSLAEWQDHSQNIFPAAFRSMPPQYVAGKVLGEMNPLKNPDDWYDPAYSQHDVSLHQFFRQANFDDAQISLAFRNPYYGTSAHDVSALLPLFTDIWTKGMVTDPPLSLACVGGNSKLAEAMANQVKRDIEFGKTVVGIRTERDHAEVHCGDGAVYRAKHVVCTIPLPVLRYVAFDPPLPEAQSRAIKTVAYNPMTQVHILVDRPFWDIDGVSPQMWTDTVVGSVAANRFNTDNDDITSLMTWSRGFNAIRLDQYEAEDAKALVISEIERLRPAAKGKIRAAFLKSWLRDPFAGGDWAVWGPGQVNTCFHSVGVPHGRIHFAGEHTARSNRGMEGAMESGERVAQEIASQ